MDLDLYKQLDLTKDATTQQIKKAYRKKALTCHPDKATTDAQREEFHKQFQQVSFAYSILSDEKKKARYDRTGSLDDDQAELFDEMYTSGQISEDMIEEDRKLYQDSQEEIDDILDAYEESKGDLTWVFECVPHTELERDEERIIKIIKQQIEDGNAKAYDKFTKENKKTKAARRKAANKEAQEAEELAKELGIGSGKSSESDLALMIQNRQKSRQDSFLDQLEAKYGGSGKANGKKKTKSSEPSEEDFERMRERSTKPKSGKAKVKK